jgi:hypothetical protein
MFEGGVKLCNSSVHRKVMETKWETWMRHCYSKQACNQTKYQMQPLRVHWPQYADYTSINVKYVDPIVEFNIDSISYDEQSMISEIGGTLGLTIGWSGFSIVSLFIWALLKSCHK